MKEIDKLVMELELLAVDLRRFASQIDFTVKNVNQAIKADDNEEVYRLVESHEQMRSLRGFNNLNKREKKTSKQLKKLIKTEP